MWISKKDKKNLELQLEKATEERDAWEAKYKCVLENQATFDSKNACVYISTRMLDELLNPLLEIKNKCESLEREVNEWKKRYADEVQKRLALIEQMKG